MHITACPHAQNRVSSRVITVHAIDDYTGGQYKDRSYYEFPRGPRVRLGLPGEYAGALSALGLALPKHWGPLPRCIVVTRQQGRMIGRALIPFFDDDPTELFEAYSDDFGFWRAKQAAKSDPYILIDAISARAA